MNPSLIKSEIVNELHKPARKIYPRRKTVLKGINDLWQIDLVEMIPYSRENKGNKYLLTVIDCFSKFAWAVPLKQKTADSVAKAMENVFLSSKSTPKHIQSDQGKEFYNSKFNSLMKQYNVNHYSTFSNIKASIVERFNRTLKEKIWRSFSLRGNYKFLDILPQILLEYNSSFHTTLGMKPIDARHKKMERYLKNNVYSSVAQKVRKQKFKEEDFVRISKQKTSFSKGYKPNWSSEIFKVDKIQKTYPYTYLLEDLKGQPISGGFYEEELQIAKHPNVYLVEKVLKRKGNKLYVQWFGVNQRGWVNKKDIV